MYPRELEKEELLSKFVKKFLTYELTPLKEETQADITELTDIISQLDIVREKFA